MSRRKPLDHTSMRRKGDPEPKTLPDQRPRKWWELTGTECAESIESTVHALQKAQAPRLRQAAISMRLYGNFSVFGPAAAVYAKAMSGQTAIKDRMTDNVIQSVVDTVHSKIGEDKPRPYFLTSGGNYRQQRKAKKLNQYVEGCYYENKTYAIGGLAFRDGEIWGDGFIHAFPRGGKIRHERVMGAELWVDEEEAQYGAPRNMHRVKDVDRDELAGYWPDKKADIMKSSKVTDAKTDSISDMVKVVESWHLGAMNAKGEIVGGKHCIALVSNGTMLVEPEDWKFPFFPFAKIPWCPRPSGYWSQGLAEQLQGDQIELNKELWHIQRSLHIGGSMKLLLHNGSKVVTETANNEIGGIIKWAGTIPPEYVVPTPIHPMYMENPQRIRERMHAKAGVSELSAAGIKPVGIDSGRGLRELQEQQSDRFKFAQNQNSAFYVEIAAITVALAMAEESLDKVRVPGKGSFAEIDLREDVGTLKDSEFVLQCFPTSRLPKDPAGRLETIQEYMQAGFMTQRQARRALDFPDLDTLESLANAQEDIISQTLDDIVFEGDYAPPEPTDDLKMAKEMVIEYIQRMRIQGLEEEKLTLLRTWNQQVDALIAQTMVAPAPVDPSAQPQANPEAAPTSDMLPNAPQAAA
jgi:hypothetical protein